MFDGAALTSPRVQWPNKARCCVVLTFDVDGETVWMQIDPEQAKRAKMISLGRYGTKRGIWRVIELLDRYKLPATFFYPGWVAEHYPDQVTAIVSRGHEIAHHGYLHEKFGDLPVAAQREAFEKGLEILGKLVNRPIEGWRPAGNPTYETIRLAIEYGFRYSSVMLDDDLPYRWVLDGKETDFIEIPFRYELDDFPFFVYSMSPAVPSGGPRISTNAHVLDIWTDAFDAYYEFGLCYNIAFHPQIIGTPPRIRMLERLLEHIVQRKDVWFATGSQLTAFWREYAKTASAKTSAFYTPLGDTSAARTTPSGAKG